MTAPLISNETSQINLIIDLSTNELGDSIRICTIDSI